LFNVSGLPGSVLVYKGLLKGCAGAIVRADKRVVYIKYLVNVHFYAFWIVPPVLRAKVDALARLVKRR
jgi:hypothetical protein